MQVVITQAYVAGASVGNSCSRNLKLDHSQADTTNPVTVTQHTLCDLWLMPHYHHISLWSMETFSQTLRQLFWLSADQADFLSTVSCNWCPWWTDMKVKERCTYNHYLTKMQKKWTAKDFRSSVLPFLKQFQVTLNKISLFLCVCYNFFTLTNVIWCRKQTKTVIVCACLLGV